MSPREVSELIATTIFTIALAVMALDSYHQLQQAKSDRDYINELLKEN